MKKKITYSEFLLKIANENAKRIRLMKCKLYEFGKDLPTGSR